MLIKMCEQQACEELADILIYSLVLLMQENNSIGQAQHMGSTISKKCFNMNIDLPKPMGTIITG